MEDGVGNRGRRTGDAEFPNDLHTKRIELNIRVVQKQDVDVRDVGVCRHQVFAEVCVNRPSTLSFVPGLLCQRHADFENHASYNLGPRQLWVDDLSRIEDAHLVDLHLGKGKPKDWWVSFSIASGGSAVTSAVKAAPRRFIIAVILTHVRSLCRDSLGSSDAFASVPASSSRRISASSS